MKQVRTRFSPSPTGQIHIGNARTALFSAFYAKNKGKFILRIEDTDAARSSEEFVDLLQNDLHWLSIAWQEGPGVGGDYGPYWQSQRQAIYAEYYDQLELNQQMYPCFCSDQELLLARKLQLSRGQAPRYMGTCKQLTKEAIAEKIAQGLKPAWRFSVPKDMEIAFEDLVKGLQKFSSNDIGDFIIRRADGTAPFLFCNAIDDATMQITHVLRGEDHVANTPRQILLLQTFGLPIPHYGHLSLILGDDGAPLSKRHGSFSVDQIRGEGYLPLAVINYLARLGHTCEEQKLLNFDELAESFQLDKLSKSPAKFDKSQLKYWQKNAVQALESNTFWRWVGEHVANQVPENQQTRFAEIIKANVEFPDDVLMWAKIIFHDHIHYALDEISVLQSAGEQFFVEAEQAFDQYAFDLPKVFDEMKKSLNVSGKKLFMPLRIALTGKKHGPEFAQLLELLGMEKVKKRLSRAFKEASNHSEEPRVSS